MAAAVVHEPTALFDPCRRAPTARVTFLFLSIDR